MCNLCTVRECVDEFSVVITIVYRVNGYGKSYGLLIKVMVMALVVIEV